MKKYIVGYNGFVGSNIAMKTTFDGKFNKENIEESFGGNPDLLVYAGVPAEVFYANKFPDEDLKIIENAENNIAKINPKKIVLISSVNVYPNDKQGYEDLEYDINELEPYGKNRLILENWVKQNCKDYLIVRLPGLFGKNIKKNFIYDLMNKIPSKLTTEKITELSKIDSRIYEYYNDNNNGFYSKKELNDGEKKELLEILDKVNFSSLNFTDSRGTYQYFNLSNLWSIIEKLLETDIKVFNVTSEPFTIAELYKYLYNKDFTNILNKPVANYNMKTKHDNLFSGINGYIYTKDEIFKDIKDFLEEESEISSI